MSHEPIVSFEILTFNSERYLNQCLLSVLGQNYTNFEVILIDGGSSDDTLNIIDDFSNRTKKIKFYQYANSSIGYARQRGIEHCSGRIIAFIDSDCVLPNEFWLSEMLKGFNKTNIAGTWVLGKYNKNDSSIMRYSILSHPLRGHEPLIVGKQNYIPIGTGHTLIKKDIIETVGGFKDIPASEDVELTYSIVEKGYYFRYIPGNEVIHYHITSLRQMIKKIQRNITGGLNSPVWKSEYMERNHLNVIKDLSFIYPLYNAITMAIKDRDIAWMWHPIIILIKYFVAVNVYFQHSRRWN